MGRACGVLRCARRGAVVVAFSRWCRVMVRGRFRSVVLSVAAVLVVAVGLPLFGFGSAASASSTGGACSVAFSGYKPVSTDSNSSLPSPLTVAVTCSGIVAPSSSGTDTIQGLVVADGLVFGITISTLANGGVWGGSFVTTFTGTDTTSAVSSNGYSIWPMFLPSPPSPLVWSSVFGDYSPSTCTDCALGAPVGAWNDVYQMVSYNGPAFSVSSAWGVVPPCVLDSVSGPSSFTNSALTYNFVTSGQDSVALIPSPSLLFTIAPPNWYAPYNLPGLDSPGSVYTFLESPMGDSFAFTMDLTNSDVSVLTGPAIAQTFAFQAWCFDGSRWYDWGDLAALVGASGSGGGGGSIGGCIAAVSIGLDPSSWVPALWSLGSCVLQALLVPSQSSVNGLTSQFNGSGGSASNWMGSVVALFAVGPTKEFQTMQSDFASPASNSLLNTSVRFQGEPASVPSVNVQDSLSALTASPQVHPFLGLILDLLTAGLLVLFFYLGVKFFINVFKG